MYSTIHQYSAIQKYSTILWYSPYLYTEKAITMANTKAKEERNYTECTKVLLPVLDALEILRGRWRIPIIISLTFGPKRFKEISKEVHGITDRMLSKELKDLEVNQLVKRTVYDDFPPVVEYAITPHGESLEKVIAELRNWGVKHRKKIIG
ncbi:MAG: helix-turn-helix domain-containing protein [Saprospiraceae bacterium]